MSALFQLARFLQGMNGSKSGIRGVAYEIKHSIVSGNFGRVAGGRFARVGGYRHLRLWFGLQWRHTGGQGPLGSGNIYRRWNAGGHGSTDAKRRESVWQRIC